MLCAAARKAMIGGISAVPDDFRASFVFKVYTF